MAKTYSFKELIKALRNHDDKFEVHAARGKGSHQMLYHPNINGRAASYPLKCHGKKTEIRAGHLPAIRRRFNLPDDIFK